MAYPKSRVKKPIYVSAEEKAKNLEILESYRKRFPPKTYRAEILYVRNTGCEFLETGRYTGNEEARLHAESMLETFNKISGGWRIENISGKDWSRLDSDEL